MGSITQPWLRVAQVCWHLWASGQSTKSSLKGHLKIVPFSCKKPRMSSGSAIPFNSTVGSSTMVSLTAKDSLTLCSCVSSALLTATSAITKTKKNLNISDAKHTALKKNLRTASQHLTGGPLYRPSSFLAHFQSFVW